MPCKEETGRKCGRIGEYGPRTSPAAFRRNLRSCGQAPGASPSQAGRRVDWAVNALTLGLLHPLMRILVVGGSGTVGKALLPQLVEQGHKVVATSRDPAAHDWPKEVRALEWRPTNPVPAAIGQVDGIVNLAGEGVMSGRWTKKRKLQLVTSRVELTRQVAEWAGMQAKPPVLVNANAVGYYGIAPQGPCPEERAPGSDFLASLCLAWQAAATSHKGRTVIFRIGHVLSTEGGYLGEMLPMLRRGLAGRLGNGRQPMPWIHVNDVAGAMEWALRAPKAQGVYNLAAPNHIDQATFARAALDAVGTRWAPPVPAFALRFRFGQAAAPILGGQDVDVDRLEGDGYKFRHNDVGEALADLTRGLSGRP